MFGDLFKNVHLFFQVAKERTIFSNPPEKRHKLSCPIDNMH